jgi:beta-N-acetylhexosaminidase
VAAVRSGRLPAERLTEAADRTRRLKSWLAESHLGAGDGFDPSAGPEIGLEGARRAIHHTGEPPVLHDPLVIELEAPGNIAVGPVPWGLSPWAEDVIRVDGGTADAAKLLARAADRSLVVVVRDAHRHEDQRRFALELLAARPDAVVVEMGLPVWRPSAVHIATYGATRANGRAAAELLGLTAR